MNQLGLIALVGGALLVAGLAATLLAGRVRLPVLVLFLGLGVLVGPDGIGLVSVRNYELVRALGVAALCLILLEGGLASGLKEIRPVLRPAISLATLGTLITALVTGLVATWILGLDLLDGLLIGATLSATDSAAIFSVLRDSRLRRRLARTLEAESGMNDPVAVLLVIGFIDWINNPGYGIGDMALLLVGELALGAAAGIAIGFGARWLLERTRLATSGLYPVATLSFGALGFGLATVVGGSGFLAVYIVGLALADAQMPARGTVRAFHEGVAWVAQLSLFIALGVLIAPGSLDDVFIEGTVIAIVTAVFARPLAVIVATAFDRFSLAERLVLGWAGLRGAVPVVLATFVVIANVENAANIFDVIFFAVVLTTLIQGASFEWFADRLGVVDAKPALQPPAEEIGQIAQLGAELMEFPVQEGDALIGRGLRELGLPPGASVVMVVRSDQALPARGSLQVERGDSLYLLVRDNALNAMDRVVQTWRDGPLPPRYLPPRLRSAAVPFSIRPRHDADGDARDPQVVGEIPVGMRLRERADIAGSLVELSDGRFALVGDQIALGTRGALQRYARERLRSSEQETDRAWFSEVIGALAR